MESTNTRSTDGEGSEPDPMPEAERPDLARACEALGYPDIPELLDELAPAVERGHHIASIAAEGSGSELLFGLAARRIAAGLGEGVRALVLTATPERAARCARAVVAMSGPRGPRATVWPPRPGPDALPDAEVIVGRPEQILAAVRAGRLGLAALRLLVIDDVAAVDEAWPVVEALLDTCTPETQKIACAHAPSARLDDLLDRQLPRARQWPAELFQLPEAEDAGASDRAPLLRYAFAAGEEALLRRLVEALHEVARAGAAERAVIRCRSPESVPRVEASLAAEGFRIAKRSEDVGIRVGVKRPAPEDQIDLGVMFGLPARGDSLRAALSGASMRLAVVETRHAAQLEILSRRLGWRTEPLGATLSAEVTDELLRFRARVRSEIDSGDLGGSLLMLEPLIEEFGAEAVAAALASMVRRRVRPMGDAGEDATAGVEALDPGVERVMRRAWTRVFVGVGKRDGAGPGDLVGAITGETGTQGAQIGRIEVRGNYSLVEVDSQVADEVVRKLRGTRIKGREVTARLDRDERRGTGRRPVS